MTDPYYVASRPDVAGHCPVDGGSHRLYYELRGRGKKPKMLCVMGAFGTCVQLGKLADQLASTFEVMVYNHRGVGRSTHTHPIRTLHTSSLLAQDAVALINHVWGPESHVHVFGVSMGGMIGQMLGLLLLGQKRLASLTLAVTTRGYYPFPLHVPFWLLLFVVVPRIVQKDRREQVKKMIPKLLPADMLMSPFPGPEGHGRTYQEVMTEAFVEQYEERFTFTQPNTCAAQVGLLLTHYLRDSHAQQLRESNVPITVIAATVDHMIKPRDQLTIAKLLGANVVTVRGGHLMAYDEDKKALLNALTSQVDNAKAAATEE